MNDRPTQRPRTPASDTRRPAAARPSGGGSARPAPRSAAGPSRSTRSTAPARSTRSTTANDVGKWLPVGAAGALLVGVIAVGVLSGGGGDPAAGETTTTNTTVAPTGAAVTTQPTTVTTPNTAPIDKTAIDRNISNGMAGDDVEMVQQRLIDLGFDPGPVDGYYGDMSVQAVWAFEKLVMGTPSAEATGVITPEMWSRMQDPLGEVFAPRRPQGQGIDHVEIYLPEQSMIVYHADQPVLITHISSGELDANGEPAQYCETIRIDTDENGNPLPEPEERPICGLAKTPGGIFDVDRFVPGTRNGPLGSMWNPIYFNYGIAIHGALNVPLVPASHGCIRIPMHISEYTQDLIAKGDNVWVWNGKKEPEQQTRDDELPVWDWIDPTRTTTTTSTTTTTTTIAPTTTTIAPTTTRAPETTQPAPPTTEPTDSAGDQPEGETATATETATAG